MAFSPYRGGVSLRSVSPDLTPTQIAAREAALAAQAAAEDAQGLAQTAETGAQAAEAAAVVAQGLAEDAQAAAEAVGATHDAQTAENMNSGTLTRSKMFSLADRKSRRDARDYLVGGVVTAAGINQAIVDAAAAGESGEVLVDSGEVELDAPIVGALGVVLRGGGNTDAPTRPGTMFIPASGYTGVGFHYPNVGGGALWHGGGLTRVGFADFVSHGVHIEGGMGECSLLDQVFVKRVGGDGFRIEGPSAPSQIGHIGAHGCGGAGLRLVSQLAATTVGYLSADNNGESAMTIDTMATQSSVRLLGWKGERWNHPLTPFGHPSVFIINDGNGGLVDFGPGQVHVGSGASLAPGAIVKQQTPGAGSVARVLIRPALYDSSGTGGYTYGYEDVPNSKTLTMAQVLRKSLNVREPVAYFDNSGYVRVAEFAATDGPALFSGTVNPESVVAAPPGSFYVRNNSGAGQVYTKSTGTGTTGWMRMPRTLIGAITTDVASIAAGASANVDITVTGAVAGDVVATGLPSSLPAGLVANGFVSASDTVRIRLTNITAAPIDPPNAAYSAMVLRAPA